ncbi:MULTISPECIES: DsbC family protein [Pseudomonas]|uniref:Thiol:disulfide interchange protein n=1 Tax=Pseudomonas quercus TaxID=2722792 RepID=A0ABX0YMR6_9PSED|nr:MULTISPECIES: DsbC family protein [Pseudomonas]MBF7144969.1 DsbC family protein [Pseudomonas sp. LY10J]NJP03594.1 DsbC family protein [Pseudomonas quercus]
MTSAYSLAPFSASVKGHHLVVTRVLGHGHQHFCSLDLRQHLSFYLLNGQVTCQGIAGQPFVLHTSNAVETNDLLNQLSTAQLRNSRQTRWLKAGCLGVAALTLAVCCALEGSLVPYLTSSASSALPPVAQAPIMPPHVAMEPSQVSPAFAEQQLQPAQQAPAPQAADGWELPQNIRETLPGKLHKAAERNLFTVNYSTGHARTLYVFADPHCPNCTRLDPALNALSDAFNVVVFPVSVIGKEQSVADITPVLCLPPEQRKPAWNALFDPGRDGLDLGKEPQAGQPGAASKDVAAANGGQPANCADAQNALGVNEVAYQTYRIPGTPWVIADDGRYVPQALLKDASRLQSFLDKKKPVDGQGAPDAAK